VEGAEHEVLRGAKSTITNSKPIILFEHAKIHNLNYDTTSEIIYDLLVNEYKMQIYNLDMKEQLDRKTFNEVYESSFQTDYDRNARTNFIALYK